MQKKGTEASKRLSLTSYNNAQARKAQNIADQQAAEAANKPFRDAKKRTPYQERKRAAYLARIAKKYGHEPTTNA